MNDKEIVNRLNEHLTEVKIKYPNTNYFVICGQGSINYPGLSDDESDIDSKMLVIPRFKDIVQDSRPVNKIYEMDNNGEHVDMKDVRKYMRTVRKQNINFIEIFFTDYWIANPFYKDIWLDMMRHADYLANMNPYRTLKCIKGMAFEKQHALEHRYPSRAYYIDTFGYDGKQLSHVLRLYDFAKKFISGYSYKECLQVNDPEFILGVKRHTVNLSLEDAKKLMDETMNKIIALEEAFNANKKDEEVQETREIYDELLYELLERAVKREINDIC